LAISRKSPIRSPRNRRFMMSRRKSRRLSCSHHVRLSGGNLHSFGDSPFAWHLSSPETRNSHSNLKPLGVKNDETPWANARSGLPGWMRFTLVVSSRNKSIGLAKTPSPWIVLRLFWQLRWRRRVLVGKRMLNIGKGSNGSWGFAAEPFA
jgi:hypothetical protein